MVFSLTITINRSFYVSIIRFFQWNEAYCMLFDFLAIHSLTPMVDMTEKYQKENIFIIIHCPLDGGGGADCGHGRGHSHGRVIWEIGNENSAVLAHFTYH